MWYSFPVGLPAAGSLFLTKQSFGHTELLSGRIAARNCILFRMTLCWLHSMHSRFEQQPRFYLRGSNRQWRGRTLPLLWSLPSAEQCPHQALGYSSATVQQMLPVHPEAPKSGKVLSRADFRPPNSPPQAPWRQKGGPGRQTEELRSWAASAPSVSSALQRALSLRSRGAERKWADGEGAS